MISHGKDIKIFTGNANPKLAADICKIIGTKLGESEVKSFADGEASVSLYETVRGSDVFLIQSTCKPVNDNLMELLIMVDACRRASAGRITAVMPYFGYARQDRKAKSRDPISAKLVANMLVAAGVDRVLTMDLHANQIRASSIFRWITCSATPSSLITTPRSSARIARIWSSSAPTSAPLPAPVPLLRRSA